MSEQNVRDYKDSGDRCNYNFDNGHKLTEKEQKKFSEFKSYVVEKYSSVRKQLWDDWFLLRFCHNKHKLKDVKKKFDEFIEFYKEYDLDNNIDFFSRENEDYNNFQKNTSKHDVISNQYEIVSIEFKKYQNDYELIKIPHKSFVRAYIKILEELKNVKYPILSAKAGKRIDKYNVVFDLKDAPLKQLLDSKIINYFKGLFLVFQDYYPESLGKILILNPPFIFYAVFALIKPFLAKATKDKVEFLRGDDVNKRMQSWIHKDMLPTEYGGNLRIDHSKKYDYFDYYLNECYKKGTYVLENGIFDKEKGIYPPDDPLERAKTINVDYKPMVSNINKRMSSSAVDCFVDTLEEEFLDTDENISKIHIPSSKNRVLLSN